MPNWKKVREKMVRASSTKATKRDKASFVAFDKCPAEMLQDGDIDQETFNAICLSRGLRTGGRHSLDPMTKKGKRRNR